MPQKIYTDEDVIDAPAKVYTDADVEEQPVAAHKVYTDADVQEQASLPPKKVYTDADVQESPVVPARKVYTDEDIAASEDPTQQTLRDEAKEGFKGWWEGKKRAYKEGGSGRDVLTTGHMALEGLGLISNKIVEPFMAAENARERGLGIKDMGQAALHELVGGHQDKELARGWQPTTGAGKVGKFALNIAPYFTSILAGGGASLLTKAGLVSKLGTVEKAGKALGKGAKVLSAIENVPTDVAFGATIGKVGTKAAAGVNNFLNNAAKNEDTFGRLVRNISPRMGQSEDAIRIGDRFNLSRAKTEGEVGAVTKLVEDEVARVAKPGENTLEVQRLLGRKLADRSKVPKESWSPFMQKYDDLINDQAQTIRDISEELTVALTKAGHSAEDIAEMNLDKTVKRLLSSDKYGIHYTYNLSPSGKVEDLPKIIGNMQNKIDNFSALAKEPGADVGKLEGYIRDTKRWKTAYEKKLNGNAEDIEKLMKEAYEQAEEMAGTSVKKAASKEGVAYHGEHGALLSRTIPEHMRDVFEPEYDVANLLKYNLRFGKELAFMKAISQEIAEHPEKARTAGSTTAEFINNIKKTANTTRTVADDAEEALNDPGVVKGISGLFPNYFTDKRAAQYLQDMYRGFSDADKKWTSIGGEGGDKLKSWVRLWKNMKLRNAGSIARNDMEGFTRASKFNVQADEFIANRSLAHQLMKGESPLSPAASRELYSVVGGSGANSMVDINEVVGINGVKIEGLTVPFKKMPGKAKQAAHSTWQELGRQFRSSDDAVKISLFQKEIERLTGRPMREVIENSKQYKQPLEVAKKYANDNTIIYDQLPTWAKVVKEYAPFFSFQLRAPRQYLRGFMKSPSRTARYKAVPEKYSQMMLDKEQDQEFTTAYNNKRNHLAALLSPVGMGNVYLGEGETNKGEPSIEELNLAALNIFDTMSGAEDYNAPIQNQLMDTASQYMGMGGTNTAPVNPLGIMLSLKDVANRDPKGLRNLIRSLAPNQLLDLAGLLTSTKEGQQITQKLGETPGFGGVLQEILEAGSPAKGAAPDKALLRMAGQKVEGSAKTNWTGAIQKSIDDAKMQADKIAKAKAERSSQLPWGDAYSKYYQQEMQRILMPRIRQVTGLTKEEIGGL